MEERERADRREAPASDRSLEYEEEAWLYLAGKPWMVTPQPLFATKDMIMEEAEPEEVWVVVPCTE